MMGPDLFLAAGVICFGLTVVGVTMKMQEFRKTNRANQGC